MLYETDSIRHNLLDKRQLAVKVSLNRYNDASFKN